MKKSVVIIIAILIAAIIIGFVLANFVFYDKYKMPKGAEIQVKEGRFEAYTEGKKLYELIGDNNLEILTEDFELDTTIVGEHTQAIEYKYKGFKKYLYNIKYQVIDTVPPVFIAGLSSTVSFYVDEASEADLEKVTSKITYGDNYDVNPTLKVKGEVDFTSIGTYKLDCIISDSSNNQTAKEIKVIIKERPKEVDKQDEEEKEKEDKEEEKYDFEKQIENYKTDNAMVGIDISKWQGEVDFEKVKEAGAEFVIMRFGVMKDKDSELVKDKTFDTNYKNAKKAGLKVGIYIYSEANNVKTAESNAQFVIDTLKGDKLDFPVAFDWESWTYFNSMKMNLHMLNDMYEAFDKKMQEAGYNTMLYGSQNYLNNTWLDLKDYTIWVARYSEKKPSMDNGNKIVLWQNSNIGRIDGIKGDVDLDVCYAD